MRDLTDDVALMRPVIDALRASGVMDAMTAGAVTAEDLSLIHI